MSQKSLFAYFKSPSNKRHGCDKEIQNLKGSTSENPKLSPKPNDSTPVRFQSKRISQSTKENTKPKRRRVIVSDESEDSDENDVRAERDAEADSNYEPEAMDTDSDVESSESSSKTTSKRLSLPSSCSTPKPPSTPNQSPSVGSKVISKLSSFSAPSELNESSEQKRHIQLEFLAEDKIRDKEKRLKSHPEYDCRTLYVPEAYKKSVTPAMRQWWDLKEDHFDTVLFFKMGKFYEFFHMDATIGVKELGLLYMKGDYAHAGFPERAYGRYADTLLRKGYKIARIEQTETPEMMSQRVSQNSRATKFDKVVRREICQITTPGTRTSNFLDGETIDTPSKHLLAVCEKVSDGRSRIGVCFLDTSIGLIHVGEFDDDRSGSRVRTLLAHHPPGHILHEKKPLSLLFSHLFKTTLSSVRKEALVCTKEFWDSERTIQVLSESDYFRKGEEPVVWPDALKNMLSEGDAVFRKAKEGYGLAMRSLGALLWYLRFSYLDDEIMSLTSFTEYVPVDRLSASTDLLLKSSKMVLDSVTLANLDIFESQSTGTREGSLIERLDRCQTAGGKRLLREWLSAPLCDPELINDRLEAVSNLKALGNLSQLQSDILKKQPDFERQLSRIHTLGHAKRAKTHPDSRAVMFDNEVYSKRKIDSFLSVIAGFKLAIQVVPFFRDVPITSKILKKCVTFTQDGGQLCDVRQQLQYFEEAFDHEAARKAGAIHPFRGYVEEYDESVKEIEELSLQLDEYLKSQRKLLGTQQVQYVGTAKNRYQLEVPDSVSGRVPSAYELSGQRKNYKRYVTEKTKTLLVELMEAEAKQDVALKDTMRKLFNKFDERYADWMSVVHSISVLDVLQSLALYTMTNEGVMCRPEIVSSSVYPQAFLDIRDGRHPCSIKTFGGSDFIPNDTVIGWEDANTETANSSAQLLLLTGPNMGGKSTLMRQVALLTILSQLGCHVPAEKCRLTPVDRLFTRLGADDRLMHGESTFFVELSETSLILQHATRHSLVLLDELGRGTATHDGTAIASAVVQELAEHVKCRTIFSTHYHSLVEDFITNQYIQLGHMACLVNEEMNDSGHAGASDADSSITFLYKLASSFCPKSYGFNVARLAGLPRKVIDLGLEKSKQLEKLTESRRFIRSVMLAEDLKKVSLISEAKES